ncbi:MAG: N-acetyltransferase family protein [Actinomycetes bacterium]
MAVRTYQPRDLPLVAAMSEGLSPESLYGRFFTGCPRLPAAYLDRLDRGLDHPSTVLLAVQDTRVVGVGELIATSTQPAHAELGLLVRDTHQRRGIGLRLVEGLIEHARESGVVVVGADVLSANRAMGSLLRKRYPTASAVMTGTTTRYELHLERTAR